MNETGTSTVKITSNEWPTDYVWPGWAYQPQPITNVACRAYKCPCGGEFNMPAIGHEMTEACSVEIKVCPFCGKKMKGMV